jgi:hypothetical protein
MWWRDQNLDQPVEDKSGRQWHFRVWYGFPEGTHVQRIFFWNEDR